MFFRAAAFQADAFAARFLGSTSAIVVATPARPTYGAAPHTLDPRKVAEKWEAIEEYEQRIEAQRQAEHERVAKIEEQRRQLADLEAKRRQTKTLAARRRKIEARMAQDEAALVAAQAMLAELLRELELARGAQMMADRRRRMLLLLAAASA